MRIPERLAHKHPVFSFEFFPPKSEAGERVLFRSLRRLSALRPDFVSVTYGAGGSTRARTVALVREIKVQFGIEAMAHVTCVGATQAEIGHLLDELAAAGVENVLALRGDPPRGQDRFVPTQGGFAHASDLVRFIRSRWDFAIGAACYPEVHPEAPDADTDLANLVTKVQAGVDFLVTQLFFDNARFFDFVQRARSAGIDVPILAGIMPITDARQIDRFVRMCGASVPDALRARLADDGGDVHEMFWSGVSFAAHQCRGLLAPCPAGPFELGAPRVDGIHFYTLNRSPATRAIFEILRLLPGT